MPDEMFNLLMPCVTESSAFPMNDMFCGSMSSTGGVGIGACVTLELLVFSYGASPNCCKLIGFRLLDSLSFINCEICL